MTKTVVVSGGPVGAKLDAVKIVTNTFKGGRLAAFAEQLSGRCIRVIYVTTKDAVQPRPGTVDRVIHHDGFLDYTRILEELAPQVDGMILGAAVANLIPANPWIGKFPSHDYKAGDIIPIDFIVAPRIISKMKKINPNLHLFGFKLLSNVSQDELVRAAYEVLLDSKATAVIANDRSDLDTKHIVTKERGVRTFTSDYRVLDFIVDCLNDEYYQTKTSSRFGRVPHPDNIEFLHNLIQSRATEFTHVPEGYIFGTVALKLKNGSFLTTGRGKSELNDFAIVDRVDHEKRIVHICDAPYFSKKASLNAPLLDHLFKTTNCDYIFHTHTMLDDAPVLAYAPPGSVRDSIRTIKTSFNISGHGRFELYKGGVML